MSKNQLISIDSISAVVEKGYDEATIYGLGVDNQIYWWRPKTKTWELLNY